MDESHPNQRAHFRLQFPEPERPLLTFDGRDYLVVDLSEGGARISLTGREGLVAGTAVTGTVRFHTGDEVAVKGVVLRVEGGQAALRFTVGIHLGRMLAEQRRLLRQYANFYRRPDDRPSSH